MANTKSIKTDKHLRRSLKRAQRRRLKAVDQGLDATTRNKLRRARKEKHVGLRAFLAKNS